MVALNQHSVMTLLTVASAGNILGSVLNYWLGRLALHYQHRKWFPVRPATLQKAQMRFAKWGQWSVMLVWVPIIGDPLTIAAGVMRMGFLRFLLLVSVSKILRYIALLGLFRFLFS